MSQLSQYAKCRGATLSHLIDKNIWFFLAYLLNKSSSSLTFSFFLAGVNSSAPLVLVLWSSDCQEFSGWYSDNCVTYKHYANTYNEYTYYAFPYSSEFAYINFIYNDNTYS